MKKIIETEYKWVPVEKTVFVAADGREFDTKKECLAYKERVEALKQFFSAAKNAGLNGEESLFAWLILKRSLRIGKTLIESLGKETHDED